MRIGKLPYLLDFDMVLELGGVRVAVRKIVPHPQFPKRHHEVLSIQTRDKKHPFNLLFDGELGRKYSEDEKHEIPYQLRDFEDLYKRKCDFRQPVDLERAKLNPYIEMEVLTGPNKGDIWKMEKNYKY